MKTKSSRIKSERTKELHKVLGDAMLNAFMDSYPGDEPEFSTYRDKLRWADKRGKENTKI